MRYNKIKSIFIILLVSMVIFLPNISIIGANKLIKSGKRQQLGQASGSLNENLVLGSDTLEQLVDLTSTFQIFGYKLIATNNNPFERDETSLLEITLQDKLLVDIKIYTKFGDFVYNSLSIEEESFCDPLDEQIYRFEIEDPYQGFFMELHIMREFSLVNLAFDGGGYQLIYDGILKKGYSEIFPVLSEGVEPVGDLSSQQDVFYQELKEHLRHQQIDNIHIYKRKDLEQHNELSSFSLRGVSFNKYGLAHEMYDSDDDHSQDEPTYLRYIPDNYWEPYTCIDIGIYRFMPNEATIKSDIEFYNKDYIVGGSGYINDVMAYNIVSEDTPALGPDWDVYQWREKSFFWVTWWEQDHVSVISPDEILELWYYYYNPSTGAEIDIHPWDSIIFAHKCYGWSHGPDDPAGPTMGHAFVDYGAAAFLASPYAVYILVPDLNNDPARDFWYKLCQENNDVEAAVLAYCAAGGNPQWATDGTWRILGNKNAIIPN